MAPGTESLSSPHATTLDSDLSIVVQSEIFWDILWWGLGLVALILLVLRLSERVWDKLHQSRHCQYQMIVSIRPLTNNILTTEYFQGGQARDV